ncbi:MAG TPA: sensor histidine kinase, partial [Usitatibacter sp.]|nr:sensor histidine kinase [Usitatibacter sp.]
AFAAAAAMLAAIEYRRGIAQPADAQALGAEVVLLAVLFVALWLVARRADQALRDEARSRALMQRQLGQSEKMVALGQMVAGVARQLNTPLAVSQSNVGVALERLRRFDPRDVPTLRQMLEDVHAGVREMSRLVAQMREFTRTEAAGGGEADVNLNQGLAIVVDMARSVMRSDVRVVEEYGELPPVRGNASQLNQVFLNLVTNAAQAIDGPGRVTVRTAAHGDKVRIDVTDTGSGIAPEALPHIFDTFFTTKPRGIGTGLGLAIALDIVRAHGGDILVETEQGFGTRFTVVLPVRASATRLGVAA